MLPAAVDSLLLPDQKVILDALHKHAVGLLDRNHRFKYLTLHGSRHIANLFNILGLLIDGGLRLSREQAFLLSAAILLHDVGMVMPLCDLDQRNLFGGRPQPTEPVNLESVLRELHHELITTYIQRFFDFLTALGLTPADCALLRDIARSHRVVDLRSTHGHVQALGALLRVIDELDIGPSRAPLPTLRENYAAMDATSCWHWFKHNVCEEWMLGHNLAYETGANPSVVFKIAVHPPRDSSIPYWLNQVRRPVYRVLFDEGAATLVKDLLHLHLAVYPTQQLCSAIAFGREWAEIEQKALSAGKRVILVIDDEVRKMEDLFLPLMERYHIIFSPNARDALDKLAAAPVHLAVVDLQVGSGFRWSPEETQDFKMTGVRLCAEIRQRFPAVKMGILTGSRYDLTEIAKRDDLEFLFKKPIDPEVFEKEVSRVLA